MEAHPSKQGPGLSGPEPTEVHASVPASPATGPKFDFLLEYFKSLREEILLTQKGRFQVVVAKFSAIALLLGIFFNKYDANAVSPVILLVVRLLPLLALLFDLMYLGEVQRGIAQIGEFIANVIEEEWFRKLPPEDVDVVLWEKHLRNKDTVIMERVSPSKAMLLFTLVLMIFGFVITGDYYGVNYWPLYWMALILFFAWVAQPVFVKRQ